VQHFDGVLQVAEMSTDQDWIGLAIFKNFADEDWVGFNFIGSGLDSD